MKNIHNILRTFYPVGQGGFFSEKHTVTLGNNETRNYNIVYDCGTVSASIKAKFNNNYSINELISSVFSKDDTIDILFISHFDEDHVNKIHLLLSSAKYIKCVIMPYLDLKTKSILINYCKINPNMQKTYDLLNNPSLFFRSSDNEYQTHIIEIKDDKMHNDENVIVSIDNLELHKQLNNGVLITINMGQQIWEFIPYNYQMKYFKIMILREIIGSKYASEIKKLIRQNSVNVLGVNAIRTELRRIYSKVGSSNLSSLMLYSGPTVLQKTVTNHSCFIQSCPAFNYCDRMCDIFGYCYIHRHSKFTNISHGCVYTGDIEISSIQKHVNNITNIFPQHYQNIGLIQIPHHGSGKNFNIRFFNGLINYMSFVAYGINNNYGHPDMKVIHDLYNGNIRVLEINDIARTKVCQLINLKF